MKTRPQGSETKLFPETAVNPTLIFGIGKV